MSQEASDLEKAAEIKEVYVWIRKIEEKNNPEDILIINTAYKQALNKIEKNNNLFEPGDSHILYQQLINVYMYKYEQLMPILKEFEKEKAYQKAIETVIPSSFLDLDKKIEYLKKFDSLRA